MGCSRHQVDDICVFRQDLWQCLNDVFNPLVRRQQAKGQEYGFAFNAEPVLVEIGIEKGKVRNAVRNHVDIADGNFKNFTQQMQNLASSGTAEDPILVLQAHHVDIVEVQERSRFFV